MPEHYTYLNALTTDTDLQKLITGAVVGVGLIALGSLATRQLRAETATPEISGIDLRGQKVGSSSSASFHDLAGHDPSVHGRLGVVPNSKLTLGSFFDFFVHAFVNFQDSILGKHNRKFLPFTGTLFLFILASNLLGLVPGIPAVTTSVWINVTMAVVVFVYFNYLGIKENGLMGYLKHFCGPFTRGPLLLIGICLFLLEVFLTLPIRILTLNLRLYWNITGDHTVVGLFTELLPPGLPVVFYVLGTFVCFMQAFIFTTLTMVYILLATQHQESGEGAHH